MPTRFALAQNTVTLNEETLRDGEQTAGVTFLLDDKVTIAQQIAAALPGCIINSGYPPISRAEFEAVRAVARSVSGAQVECAGRATREDFALCYRAVTDAEMPRVSFWFPISRLMLDSRLGMSQAEVLDHAVDLVNFGRDLVGERAGIDVALADVSHTPETDLVVEACQRLSAAGADMIVICDTVGRMLPDEVSNLVRRLVAGAPEAGICFHAHHDLGNGTANSIAALRAGARAVATAVNGLGERAGMPPTEEVVANLLLRRDAHGLNLKADSTALLALSRLVAQRSGITPHANKPVVGSSVLRRETGTQIDWMQRDRRTFQVITPDFLGVEKIEIVVGKMNSQESFALALAERGIHLSADDLRRAFDGLKELTGRQRTVSEADLRRLVGMA
jgi:2-isopropylmalate synthase